jgi:hypothetical protein
VAFEVDVFACQALSAAGVAVVRTSTQQALSDSQSVPKAQILVTERDCPGSGRRLLQAGIIGLDINVLESTDSSSVVPTGAMVLSSTDY